MRITKLLLATTKEAKQFDSVNATLLQKAGFVHQTMAGVYTMLPLGFRVLTKIENIVREEMDKLGAEMLMPALAPQALWQQTGRLDEVDVLFEARGGNEASRKVNDATYVLNSTHEEVITPIVKEFRPGYKDLPCAVYQFQTKFRNEPRPKSGLLRGREFRMKDLYSFHASEEDFKQYYEQVKEAYLQIFTVLGLGEDTRVVLAGGGTFTKGYTHEFDTKCEAGEDLVYFDEENNIYYNKEVAPDEVKKKYAPYQAAEVGNIFPLGTKYAEAFDYYVTDQQGEKTLVYMGSYGLGTTRVLGVLVEKFHDKRGIVWPENVAPYTAHLIGLNGEKKEVRRRTEEVYGKLKEAGVDVLYDDRAGASAGEKLAEADLIGVPWRVIVSEKTGNKVEIKKRKDKKERMVELAEFISLC
ncbi:MAG: aminoacyl--tRNA ligase-related protein [bacterium]